MRKLKVAAYCRVSTEKDEQINSLENQKSYFREYIERHPDWLYIETYYDEGITGTLTKKRTGFNRMINDALMGNIDLILTKEVSRFARNTLDTIEYSRKLKKYGVGVIFTIDNIDTRKLEDEFRLTLMASLAQEESRKTSERVKWGQLRQMERGVVFGQDMLGYYVRSGVLYINEDEAPVVRKIFEKYAIQGKGTHVIARELEEEGFRPKRCKRWNNTVILRVLKNEKYVGDLCQKKTITLDYLTHEKKYNQGEEEMVYLSNHHEPIISRDLWEQTQRELTRRSMTKEQKSKHSNRYWCSGKLRCGVCGGSCSNRTKKYKDGTIYRAWHCDEAAKHGKRRIDDDGNIRGCILKSYNEKTVLIVIQKCIQYIFGNFDTMKKQVIDEIKKFQGKTQEDDDIVKLEEKLKIISDKKKRVIELYVKEAISVDDVKVQNAEYDEEAKVIQKKIDLISQNISVRRRQETEMDTWIQALDDILSFMHDDTHILSEEICGIIVEKILFYPEMEIHVFLKKIPYVFQVKFKTSGQRDKYKTEITEINIVKNFNDASSEV